MTQAINSSAEPGPAQTIRAAQYVRMSTEHQKYSTENQAEIIARYAAQRGFEIVKTYADNGKSGLRLDGRDALKRLIADVQAGRADFKVVLVYDVSRWGRFQDADESAYYEFLCREAGISIHYCAEQFENDGSLSATIIKSMKRAMAGEYSRELSVKVFTGQCRLIGLGYRQGGPAGYGLRRQLVDEQRQPKATLMRGEHKSLQTDRVVLTPGPAEEIDLVQRIYRMFVLNRRSEREIAALLNGEGQVTDLGRPWTRGVVHQILTNEKYIGNNVYNRVSFKLKKKRVANTPDMWVRADGAFEGIVDPDFFAAAQRIIAERCRRYTDAEMLDAKAKIGAGGLGCEPASAASVAGLLKLVREGVIDPNERAVCILTAHLLKDPTATVAYHSSDPKTFEDVLGKRGVRRANFANRAVQVPNDLSEIVKAIELYA